MLLLIGQLDFEPFKKLPIETYKAGSLEDVPKQVKSNVKIIVSRGAHFFYDEKIFQQFPNLKYLFLAQIWTDNVDFEAAQRHWVVVKNFVSPLTVDSVAELAVGMLILGIKQAFYLGNLLKNWTYTRQVLGRNMANVKIGLLGFGRIWQKIRDLLKLFGAQIVVYDVVFEKWNDNKVKDLEGKFNIKVAKSLEQFLQQAEYISVQVPGQWNEKLLDYEKLKNIKWLVNVARPYVVVENDVLKLLDEDKLQFYATDVLEWEPDIRKINKKLLQHPKVFATPHIGANTEEVQQDLVRQIAEEIKNLVGKRK